jgi:hypothetical protein
MDYHPHLHYFLEEDLLVEYYLNHLIRQLDLRHRRLNLRLHLLQVEYLKNLHHRQQML